MPRLHLADSKVKKRRKVTTATGNHHLSSSSHNNTNTTANDDNVNDLVLQEFSDFASDEFDFDRSSSSHSGMNDSKTTKTKKPNSGNQSNSTQSNESRSNPSQTTSTSKPKKLSTTSGGGASKKSSYTKLYNSSIHHNDNDNDNDNDHEISRSANTMKTKKKRSNKKVVSLKCSSKQEPQCTTTSSSEEESLCDTNQENNDDNAPPPSNKSKKKRKKKKVVVANSFIDSNDDDDKVNAIVVDKITRDKASANKSTTTNVVTTKRSHPRLKSSVILHNQTKTTILPHRVVAVDNRALSSIEGDIMSRSFGLKMSKFLSEALEKDVLLPLAHDHCSFKSCGDAVFVSLMQEGSSGVGVQCSYLLEGVARVKGASEVEKWFLERLKPVNPCGVVSESFLDGQVRFRFDYGDDMEVDHVDKKEQQVDGFEAKDSWSHFAQMVEAACHKVSSGSNKSPYALSIFATDAVMFADTNPESHVTAFNTFWKRVSKCVSGVISSITIIIVDVTSAMQAMKTTRDECSDTSLPTRLQILQCINLICRRIQELSDTSIKIKLEFMDGSSVDFQTLLQMWTRESLAQTYQANSDIDSIDGKLQFELPETIDGTMCSISLDLQYTILPDRLDSSSTMKLVQDMQLLSSLSANSVEVLQTVPLQSVDSSLIYGVPMYARPGLEHDLFQYNQMKILVRQLLKYLSENDVALVLRIRHSLHKDDQEGPVASRSRNRLNDQLFLLTSQVAVQKQSIHMNTERCMQSSSALEIEPDRHRKGESPCNGILYRYATKDQILHFGNEESNSKLEDDANSAEVSEYADYIERSMDMLTCTGLNPFLVGESNGFIGSAFSQSQESNPL